jgi:hypothetical protein
MLIICKVGYLKSAEKVTISKLSHRHCVQWLVDVTTTTDTDCSAKRAAALHPLTLKGTPDETLQRPTWWQLNFYCLVIKEKKKPHDVALGPDHASTRCVHLCY